VKVPAGESMRSSADASPSPANPVIAIVSNTNQPVPGAPPEYDGSATITVVTKDRADTAPGGNPEGPSGYEYMGPNVMISSADQANYSIAFEVDGSLRMPGFIPGSTPINKNQFFFHRIPTGQPDSTGFNYSAATFSAVETFGDGDYRMSVGRGGLGSYDVLQQAFYANAHDSHNELPDALKNGVGVSLQTNFDCSVDWTIKVSSAVAHTLKLKSTTIGHKFFAKRGGGDQRVRLVPAARRALRHYSRVSVMALSVATAPNGQVIKDKHTWSLTTPQSQLG
jgi:hypothetical protein